MGPKPGLDALETRLNSRPHRASVVTIPTLQSSPLPHKRAIKIILLVQHEFPPRTGPARDMWAPPGVLIIWRPLKPIFFQLIFA